MMSCQRVVGAGQRAAAFASGVVDQHRDLAEPRPRRAFQRLHVLEPADIGAHGQRLAFDRRRHRLQPVRHVGQHHAHADCREPLRRGEADAARGTRDHGDAAGAERRVTVMGGHQRNALKVMSVWVSFTPGIVCSFSVTNSPVSCSGSR